MQAHWEDTGKQLIFTIKANRFLRNMVRAIVGTMLEIGQGKITEQELRTIIESKNRCNAGTSVPGHALFLCDIEYPLILKQQQNYETNHHSFSFHPFLIFIRKGIYSVPQCRNQHLDMLSGIRIIFTIRPHGHTGARFLS